MLRKLFLKNLWERGLELVRLACSGMDETELVSMETETAEAIVAAAVFLVAYDGMAEVLCMHTNLVFATRVEVEVHQRILVVANQHLVMCDGELAPVVGRA